MFIGREMDLRFLEERYQSPGGQLVILYGRRRIGKTETLRKFCEKKTHVFYSCTECTDAQQLQAFSSRMLAQGIPASRYVRNFADWEQALGSVTDLPYIGKKLLIIDEFPYLVRNNGAVPSILQNLWDSRLRHENIMIVLCGSAMSFIEKEVLAERNPLYGRATGILKMREMTFSEASQFFPGYSHLDRIAAVAVLGGIPHYLVQFDPATSLEDNIKKKILQRGSILYSEVEFLMRQELRETTVYNTVIQAIALGNTKLNDIHQKTQIDKNKLSVYLKNLIELGIVCREFPVSAGVKETANVQRGLYQIVDNFFRFWYAFVFPNLSELEMGDTDGIYAHAVSPMLEQYVSRIYEEICRDYLRFQNRLHRLPFRFTKIGRWWDKDNEIDIMATNPERDSYLLGECKFRNSPLTMGELTAILGKFRPPADNAKLYYYLFSKGGFTAEVQKTAGERGIRLLGVEELFKDQQ